VAGRVAHLPSMPDVRAERGRDGRVDVVVDAVPLADVLNDWRALSVDGMGEFGAMYWITLQPQREIEPGSAE
jgi:hypothetical protein